MTIAIAVVTIVLASLGVAGGLQELVVQGIFGNQKIPLTAGTLGTVVSGLMVYAGIALLRRAPDAVALTRAAAISGVVSALLVGKLALGLAGWPMTLAGMVWPVFLLVHFRHVPWRAEPGHPSASASIM